MLRSTHASIYWKRHINLTFVHSVCDCVATYSEIYIYIYFIYIFIHLFERSHKYGAWSTTIIAI